MPSLHFIEIKNQLISWQRTQIKFAQGKQTQVDPKHRQSPIRLSFSYVTTYKSKHVQFNTCTIRLLASIYQKIMF